MTSTLRIIPLGGLGEVGKNTTLFESGRNILIVDAGIRFPENDLWGIDMVIPDYTYLREHADQVRGIVVTHGHEDHIGGLPYLLGDVLPIATPIYGTRLACGLIEAKLSEHPGLEHPNLNRVPAGDTFSVGPFEIEFLGINHSIPDGVGLAITTGAGTVIHTGDFKFDYTPVQGGGPDFSRLGQLGALGVLALLSDSTGAERAGYTPSEAMIDAGFDKIFREAPGRIIIATFASLLSRIQQVVNAAHAHNRVVAMAGYSMLKNTEIARELGHLVIPKGTLVELRDALRLPAARVAIVTTGSQGQPAAALARMAEGTHRQLEVKPGDTIVLSSTPIPGNEEEVSRVINKLFERGADVLYPPLADVHVSGHASQEEQKLMLSLTKPRFFVPVHGELRHQHAHAKIGRQLGIASEDIFTLKNGDVLELTPDSARVLNPVPSGDVFVDGAGVGDIGPVVMGEREILARDGFVIAIVSVSAATGEVIERPELVSRGFVYRLESGDLLAQAAEQVWKALRASGSRKQQAIVEYTQGTLTRFFYEQTRRKPMVVAVVSRV